MAYHYVTSIPWIIVHYERANHSETTARPECGVCVCVCVSVVSVLLSPGGYEVALRQRLTPHPGHSHPMLDVLEALAQVGPPYAHVDAPLQRPCGGLDLKI